MLDLMAIVSHELKSPLATVQTTADTLYRGYFGKLEPDQQKIVETILRNCEYLEDIIRSYIDLSKMEIDGLESFQGGHPTRRGRRRRGAGRCPSIRDNLRRMPIVTEIDGRPGHRRGPRAAQDRRPQPGQQRRQVRPRGDARPDQAGAREDGEIVLSVRNEGVGIAPEDIRDRLFKRFERLKQKGTEGVKGSGLGLYICKTIVDKHKGRIWAESEPGELGRVLRRPARLGAPGLTAGRVLRRPIPPRDLLAVLTPPAAPLDTTPGIRRRERRKERAMAKESRVDVVFKGGMKFEAKVRAGPGTTVDLDFAPEGEAIGGYHAPWSCSSRAWPAAAARSWSGSSSGWARRSRT